MLLPRLLPQKVNSRRLHTFRIWNLESGTWKLAHDFLDVLAPARCLSCLREGAWLCQACEQNLPQFQQRCIVCDKEKPRGATCASHRDATALSGVISAGGYGWPHIQRGVHWLKFRNITAVAPVLASFITQQLPLIAPLPFLRTQATLVPIPLHPRRQRERGFNQSLKIGQAVCEQTGIELHDVLLRARATASQTELPHEMRKENVSEAFALKPHFAKATRGRRYFLLLDDVITTGSTISAAAKVLKDSGAPEIWGIGVARG